MPTETVTASVSPLPALFRKPCFGFVHFALFLLVHRAEQCASHVHLCKQVHSGLFEN